MHRKYGFNRNLSGDPIIKFSYEITKLVKKFAFIVHGLCIYPDYPYRTCDVRDLSVRRRAHHHLQEHYAKWKLIKIL
jgi:hypothetical protein